MAVLTLGGIVFEEWELPEEVPLGGKHAGKLHKLPGGVRIFDAQGPDDDDPSWKGRFRSNSALGRAQQIDAMRREGLPHDLEVLGLSYTVIISQFKFIVRRAYEIDYEITLFILEDNSQGIDFLDIFGALDDLVGGDLSVGFGALAGLSDVIDMASYDLNTAIGASPLAGASLSALAPVKTAAHSLNRAIDSAIDLTDAAIMSDPYGADPLETGSAGLASTLAAMNRQSSLLRGSAYVGRAVANIDNDPG
jgi:hypothetical protein